MYLLQHFPAFVKSNKATLFSFLLLFLTQTAFTQSILYVDSSKVVSGNGFAWASAFTTLQEALDSAKLTPSVSEIWVAKGTYYPTVDANGLVPLSAPKDKTFSMLNNVIIYGGFPHDGSGSMSNRNPITNETILSGDIGVPGDVSDNSYNVVYNGNSINNTAQLNGFVITGGYANSTSAPKSYGGGMLNDGGNGSCSPTIINCVFRNNQAGRGGGVANLGDYGTCNPTFSNCLFYQNQASLSGSKNGGAMHCLANVNSILTNCTFANNTALGRGGGLSLDYNFGNPNITLKNCIFWGNTAAFGGNQMYLVGTTLTISNTTIQGGIAAIAQVISTINNNGNILTNDPLFVNAANGNYNLTPCSPALNVGDNTGVSATDITGNPRIFNSIVDFGAFELQSMPAPARLYVNASATGAHTGLSWADAFNDLQSALNYSNSICLTEIWVAQGSYQPTATLDRNISFNMKNGVIIYGGFPHDGTGSMSNRNPIVHETILSGDIGVPGDVSDNSYNVVYNGNGINNTAQLNGFVITGGYANGTSFTKFVGGGMCNDGRNGSCSPTIINCVFRNNQARLGGGVVNDGYQGTCNPTFSNCLFYQNQASLNFSGSSGGAMFCIGNVNSILTNCTFANNTALGQGGGLYLASNFGSPNITLKNCILWGNTAAYGGNQMHISGTTLTISNTTLQGGIAAIFQLGSLNTINNNGNILTNDPLFVNAANGNYNLTLCSPALNVGDNTGVAATDISGNPRIFNSIVDLGAFELQSMPAPARLYVNASATGAHTGLSWADAFNDLQSALNYSNSICLTEIWVAQGSYQPTTTLDRNISFNMKNGVIIYGGFPHDGTGSMSNRNPIVHETILSGDIGVPGDVSDNSYNVVYNGNGINNTAQLNGFVITGGYANGTSAPKFFGGGMCNDGRNGSCSPTIINCVFRNNQARLGGGVANNGDNGTCNPTFSNCLFYQNQASLNFSVSDGGAMYCQGNVNSILSNCTFANNTALGKGGGLFLVYNYGNPNITLKNCILWGNTAASGGNQMFLGNTTLTISNTTIQGGIAGIAQVGANTINNNGNILTTDPLFVNAANGNYNLTLCSPALNVGDNTGLTTTDITGNPRIFNSIVDFGAFEYQGFPPSPGTSSNVSACDSYTWNNITYDSSGTYMGTFTSSIGCDSTHTLNLTINASTANSTSATACDNYTWSVNGSTYTTSGTYTVTSTNSVGCIHTETLNLIINASTANSTSATACDNYTWSVNGSTYTTSGTYTATSANSVGCTHTETLNLIINASTSNNTSASACATYTWSADGNIYIQSGNYTYASVNSVGCVHSDTLNLTINPLPFVSAPSISYCSGAINLGGSPSGGYWDLPNPYNGPATSYTYYYEDSNGCTDSATASIASQTSVISNLQVSNITGINAMVTWTGDAPRYDIRYKVVGATSWNTTITSNAPNKALSGLSANTNYTIEVRGYCTITTPGSWEGISFSTNNVCVTPTGLQVTALTGTTATLNWLSTGAGFYTVRYKKVSQTSWTNATTPSLSKPIAGLSVSTPYEFQVKSHCGTSSSGFSASTFFTTGISRASGLGTEMNDLSAEISIYPNPVHDELHIDYPAEENGMSMVKIVDMSGRVVKQIQTETTLGTNQIMLNLGELANGIYSVQLFIHEQRLTVKRFIKN